MTLPHLTSISRGTYSAEHGTPDAIFHMVHKILGGDITHDLASNITDAHRLCALQGGPHVYWYRDNPCPREPTLPAGSRVYCNPPGPGKAILPFWRTWCHCIMEGASGAFLIFNADHWRYLTKPNFDVCGVMFRKRIRFERAKSGASFPSILVWTPGDCESRFMDLYGNVFQW